MQTCLSSGCVPGEHTVMLGAVCNSWQITFYDTAAAPVRPDLSYVRMLHHTDLAGKLTRVKSDSKSHSTLTPTSAESHILQFKMDWQG